MAMKKDMRTYVTIVTVAVVLGMMAGRAQAQTTYSYTQTAGGAQSWTNAANWNPAAVPSPVSGDTIDFSTVNIGANTTLTLGADRTAEVWNFGDTSGAQTWTVNSGNTLILAGTTPTINVVNNTATLNSVVDGTAGLTKTGTGTLTLSGNNTYSGGTVINAGVINITADAHLGASTGDITFNGGTLVIPAGNVITSSRKITVNSGIVGTMGAATAANGGSFTLNGNLEGDSTSTFVYSAPNDNRLTLNGAGGFAGTLWIQGFQTVRDGVVVNNGGAIADTAAPIKLGLPGVTSAGNAGYANMFATTVAAPLSFSNRWIEMGNHMALVSENASAANALAFTKPFVVTATTPSTLTLGGKNTGINLLGGGITDGPTGAAVSLKLDGAGFGSNPGTWYIGGTNTYSGATTINAGVLTFRGKAALPSASVITMKDATTLKLLDDGAGVINYGNNFTMVNRQPATLFVGNNGAANGGDGAGVTTDSVISLGVFNASTSTSSGGGVNWGLNITGANGYSVRFAGMTLNTTKGDPLNSACTLNPTTASVEVAGTIQQRNGRPADGADALVLDGIATGNVVSGVIMDAADYPTNPNAVPLKVTKSNSSTWTLSGVNTYSGTTTVSGGTLVIDGGSKSQCLPDTNLLTIASGQLQLNTGVREKVGSLKLGSGATITGPTSYGSSASSAENKDDTYFAVAGTGVLYVGMDIPPSGTVIMFR